MESSIAPTISMSLPPLLMNGVRSTLLVSMMPDNSTIRAAHVFGSKVRESIVGFLVMRYRIVPSDGLYWNASPAAGGIEGLALSPKVLARNVAPSRIGH